jgi:uncharacterized protein YbcV (DUF1398 family)
MFTLENIEAAHSKVKSGTDFPAYVQELISIGVSSYQIQVSDGKTIYSSTDGHTLSGIPKYKELSIHQKVDKEQFVTALKEHQNGITDFLTFCNDCAMSGIYSWKLDFVNMTCTYLSMDNEIVLIENIPG